MFKKTILLASLVTLSACQSAEQSTKQKTKESEAQATEQSSDPSSDQISSTNSAAEKIAALILDFSKTEVKTDSCVPKIELKEIEGKNISSIKGKAEMYDGSGKMFHSTGLNIKVNHPMANVLFYPQNVTCKDLSLKIIVSECTAKADSNQSIKCPSIDSTGTDSIKKVSLTVSG